MINFHCASQNGSGCLWVAWVGMYRLNDSDSCNCCLFSARYSVHVEKNLHPRWRETGCHFRFSTVETVMLQCTGQFSPGNCRRKVRRRPTMASSDWLSWRPKLMLAWENGRSRVQGWTPARLMKLRGLCRQPPCYITVTGLVAPAGNEAQSGLSALWSLVLQCFFPSWHFFPQQLFMLGQFLRTCRGHVGSVA